MSRQRGPMISTQLFWARYPAEAAPNGLPALFSGREDRTPVTSGQATRMPRAGPELKGVSISYAGSMNVESSIPVKS